MIKTRDKKESDKIFNELYDEYKKLDIETVSFIKGINTYNKYAKDSTSYKQTAKGMQAHMRGAYYHNLLLKDLKIEGSYPPLKQGDKVRFTLLKTPNKFDIDIVGFVGKYPREFEEVFAVDYERMFVDNVYKKIKYFYDAVKWHLRKPTENVRHELEDIFGL